MAINFVAASSQRAVVPNGTSLTNITGATISVWVRLTSPIGVDPRYVYHWSNGVNAAARRVSLSMGEPNVAVPLTSWALLARRLDADPIEVLSTPATLGVIQHLVAVMGWNTQTFQLFVNGTLATSSSPAGWTGASSNTNSVLTQIAAWNNLSTDLWFMNGLVEDLRVFQRVLAPAEIRNLYMYKGADRNVLGQINRWRMRGFIAGTPATGVGGVKDFALGRMHATPFNNPSTAADITNPGPRQLAWSG